MESQLAPQQGKSISIELSAYTLTLESPDRLVKPMRMTKVQLERLARGMISELKSNQIISFKVTEDVVLKRAVEILEEDLMVERKLEQEAQRMVDDLERKGSGEFDRHKMYLMIKKKLAQDRKVIL